MWVCALWVGVRDMFHSSRRPPCCSPARSISALLVWNVRAVLTSNTVAVAPVACLKGVWSVRSERTWNSGDRQGGLVTSIAFWLCDFNVVQHAQWTLFISLHFCSSNVMHWELNLRQTFQSLGENESELPMAQLLDIYQVWTLTMSLCPLYPQGNNAPTPMTECVTAGSWQTDRGISQPKLTDG